MLLYLHVELALFFSDKRNVLTLGIVSVFGDITGSALYSLFLRSFRCEGFMTYKTLPTHLVGAIVVGVDGVCAMGCTIGQGLFSASPLSTINFVALLLVFTGSAVALKFQVWQVERLL